MRQGLRPFMPRAHAFIISNRHAVVLVFGGTEPADVIQWATDTNVSSHSSALWLELGKVLLLVCLLKIWSARCQWGA